MDDDKILEETQIEGIADELEAAAEEAGEAVEEIVKETEDVSEAVEETVKETEGVSEAIEEIVEESESVNDKADVRTEAPVSKKTTVVLVSMILILIAVIIVFAALFFKKIKDNKDQSAGTTTTTTTIGTTDSTGTSDSSSSDTTSSSAATTASTVDYNVTVTLGQYKGLEVDYEIEEVTDEDVEDALALFLEDCTDYVDVTDREVREGDIVNIDYTGYMDGELFDGGADTDYDLEIGSGTFIDGFESQLVGTEVGSTVSIDVTFPDPYTNNPDFAGKPATFEVTVNSIVELVTPELSDQLIADNTEYQTVEEYRAYLREQLEAEAEENAQSNVETAIIELLISNATFEGDIDLQVKDNAASYMSYYDSIASAYYGVDGATLFAYMYGITADEYESMIYDQAEHSVKYNYILNEIAKLENITVSDEEYEATFEEIFYDYYGYTSKEELLQDATQEEIDEMVNSSVINDKAEAIVMDSAIINK